MALFLKDLDGDNDLTVTEFSPSDFLIRIQAFSSMSESGVDKYDCSEFESGGFKWKLIIYPNGNGDNSDHVSVYLSVADASSLGMRWEANAEFGIFVKNKKTEKYLCKGLHTRHQFDALSHGKGFSKFVSKKVLMDPCNGYLVDDSCILGAQVFVFNRPTMQRLCWKETSTEPLAQNNFSWVISEFSKFKGGEHWRSPDFVCGDNKWYVKLYPKGDSLAKGQSISVFLCLVDPGRYRVNTKHSILIKNQNMYHQFNSDPCNWFSISNPSWGWNNFMGIADISDPEKGFLVNDGCLLELELAVVAVTHT